jgi:hypothetical protein
MAATKIVNGAVVEMTPEEEAAFEASRTPTLGQARRAAKNLIRDRRDQAEKTFPYLTARYDASAAGRIAVLANAARISGAGFPVRFVALDDSEVGLSRAEMQTFEAALATHLQACSSNAKTLRDAVQAAGDVAAVRAVDVEAGWP